MILNRSMPKTSLKIHETKPNRVESRNRETHNYNQGLQHPLLTTVITTSQKLGKDTEELNNTINQPDLIGIIYICEALHLTISEYNFFFQVSMEWSPR